MKKRLVVLALVLALTSISAADLIWSEDTVTGTVGQTLMVQILTTRTGTYANGPIYVAGDPATGIAEIVSITPGAYTGPDYHIWPPSETGYAGVWSLHPGNNLPFPVGSAPYDQWHVSIRCDALGTCAFGADWDETEGYNDLLTVNVVPEPATIALLAFGGLFLGRRKYRWMI